MIVYPNQKIATVQKAPADKNHVYGVFSKDALFRACRELTGNEMKTFLYIAANQQGYPCR